MALGRHMGVTGMRGAGQSSAARGVAEGEDQHGLPPRPAACTKEPQGRAG